MGRSSPPAATLVAAAASGAAAVLLATAAASAADLALPIKAPAVLPAYNWTGFYGGANIGYGVASSPSTVVSTDIFSPLPYQNDRFKLSPDGILGGGQAGYNWQFSQWLLGLEADIQASGQKDTACLIYCKPPIVSDTIENRLPWFGTVRGRLGFAADRTLFYATGGLAYGRAETSVAVVNGVTHPIFRGDISSVRTGWTLGGGIETALWGAWTGKIEYLHADLGSQSLTVPDFFNDSNVNSTRIRNNIVRLGVNYRLGGAPAGPGPSVAARPAFDWARGYAGVNLGYGLARDPTAYTITQNNDVPFANETFQTMPEGVIGGLQAGYNWRLASSQRDSACVVVCNGPENALPTMGLVEQKLPWFGTVRGRLGSDLGPALIYATGGLAYGRAETTVTQQLQNLSGTIARNTGGSANAIRAGWTIGGGIEAPVAQDVTVKLEYLYVDLGSQSVAFNTANVGVSIFPSTTTVSAPLRDNIVRAGLNYAFGGPAGARP
jgi:outer membrane immunogenic protein